ncbi:SpoIIE family protein phosphatase [Kitasatospora sp. NPDC085895]|uniref:ATP-binding SpoIIE family protein phosphatase n=1 Tax=Kitasatospora sp. NPDC085895 TaxID=3155057 RepID=UPI00344DBAAA
MTDRTHGFQPEDVDDDAEPFSPEEAQLKDMLSATENAIFDALGPVVDVEGELAKIKKRIRSRQQPKADTEPLQSPAEMSATAQARPEHAAPSSLAVAGRPIPSVAARTGRSRPAYGARAGRDVGILSPRQGPSASLPGRSEVSPHQTGDPSLARGEVLYMLRSLREGLGDSRDPEKIARSLCEVFTPPVADFACVHLLDGLISDSKLPDKRPDDRTMLRRVAAQVVSSSLGQWDHVLNEGVLLAMPRSTPPGLALQENQPVLVPVIDPDVAVDFAALLGGGPDLVPVVAGCSMLVLPLSARGTVLGILTLLRLPDRSPFDGGETGALQEVAAWAALSLDDARLHRAESRVATTLQRSMIPTRPPRFPGVQIAHRYLPGDSRAEVGGDWFDAIQLPGSRVALVVGDVMGYGLHSAAAMGRFRTAMQTLAALDLPPGQLLRHLDNLAHKLGDDHLATCLYAVYDPINRTCELASAGHVPPVLVHPDGRGELLEIPGGAPIGVGGVPFVAKRIDVSDGSMLVMCTDGLVEVRGGDIGEGLAALCGNLIDPKQTPDETCDSIMRTLHSDDQQDDITLLVARFDGMPPSEVATWELAGAEEEVRRARRLVRDQLGVWQLDALISDTELLVSELVTNAVRVSHGHVQLQLILGEKLLVEVSDDSHNLPSLEPGGPRDEYGRGLRLVSTISERWGTARKAVGKVVWFELALPDCSGQ